MNAPLKNEKWTKAFGLSTAPMSYDVYTSQKQFEQERDHIFRKSWLNVGRLENIPHPGDYIVHEMPLLKTSILLIHGRDGKVRGFHNMCSHRGNKICPEFADLTSFVKGGNKRAFVCEFHGWVFNDQGALVDMTDEENFFGLDKSKLNLQPVAVDLWEGFIFFNLDPNPKESLKSFLGEVVDELAGYPFGKLTTIFGYEGELSCNWKLSVDSQVEGYHAVTLHRRTLGGALGGEDNPMLHMLDFKLLGKHHRLSMPAGLSPSRGPVDDLAAKHGPSIRSYDGGMLDRNNLPKGVNPTRSDRWAADIYFVFPNFWIAVFDGQYQTHNFWPLAVDRLYQRINMYGQQPSTASERWALEYGRVMSSNVWLEDFSTLEVSQEMASSGVFKEMYLQDQEVLVRRFHQIIDQEITAKGEKI